METTATLTLDRVHALPEGAVEVVYACAWPGLAERGCKPHRRTAILRRWSNASAWSRWA
jgi:hypothetical protein